MTVRTIDRRWFLSSLALLPTLAGCLHQNHAKSHKKEAAVPSSTRLRLLATITNVLAKASDPLRGGAQNPGFVGKVYLMLDAETKPITGEGGTLIVDLFLHGEFNTEPRMVEEWRFDAPSLAKFAKSDIVGPCYTIFLPWGSYDPSATRASLQLRYTSSRGEEVFTQTEVMTLDHSALMDKSKTAPINLK
jgi:hypothetical protein